MRGKHLFQLRTANRVGEVPYVQSGAHLDLLLWAAATRHFSFRVPLKEADVPAERWKATEVGVTSSKFSYLTPSTNQPAKILSENRAGVQSPACGKNSTGLIAFNGADSPRHGRR